MQRVESYLEGEPDDEHADDDLAVRLDAEDIESFDWSLACAPTHPGAIAIDVSHPKTYVAIFRRAMPLLLSYGMRAFDRAALLETERNFTRELAGLYRAAATRADGTLEAVGLRYESRLPPGWECWALWEPLPLAVSHTASEPVTSETPALRRAAAQLGVVLVS